MAVPSIITAWPRFLFDSLVWTRITRDICNLLLFLLDSLSRLKGTRTHTHTYTWSVWYVSLSFSLSELWKQSFSPAVKRSYQWWQDLWCAMAAPLWKVSVETKCHPTGSVNKRHSSENCHPRRPHQLCPLMTHVELLQTSYYCVT